ncbi:MAG: orotate phosphoribosyltransferase [Symbiobacteriia bacterium]
MAVHEELEPLSPAEVMRLLEETGVALSGHFLLTSGRHSPRFMQMSQVWQYPAEAERLARALARKVIEQLGPDAAETVAGPAMGGVIIGYEVARALGLRSIYTEKDGEAMALKRGFRIRPGERVLLTEDAVTTGGSVKKAMAALQAAGAVPVAVAAAVDRSLGKADLGVPLISLLELEVPSYAPDDCPLCRQGLPLTKPKSVTA